MPTGFMSLLSGACLFVWVCRGNKDDLGGMGPPMGPPVTWGLSRCLRAFYKEGKSLPSFGFVVCGVCFFI